MDDELFDEPRNCPTCKVETYCDNCPVCGRYLPRTSKSLWNMKHKHDTAGEEANNNSRKRESIEEKLLETVHHGYRNSSNSNENAQHIGPSISFEQKTTPKSKQNKHGEEQFRSEYKSNAGLIAKVIATFIVILIILGLFGYIAGTKAGTAFSNLTSIPTSNSSVIVGYEYTYNEYDETSEISIENTSGQVYYGDIVFYDEEGVAVSEREDLTMFPYEYFSFDVYTTGKAASFEIVEDNLHDLKTEAPEYPYTTFNDYGYLNVYLEKDVTQDELKTLVKHMIEAGEVNKDETIYNVTLWVEEVQYYDCFIDKAEGLISVYPSEDAIFIQDMFEFDNSGNTLYKGTSKDLEL